MYGIGTYMREMTAYLCCQKDISLNIVQLHAERKDFTIEQENGYKVYNFPYNRHPSNNRNQQRYYKNIWYILRQYIKPDKQDRLVFHLNFHQEHSLISILKKDFPECLTIYTIHYQEWFFLLNGNYSKFKKIINSEKDIPIGSIEKDVFYSYKKEKLLYTNVDAIICLGNYARDILTEDYKISDNKIKVINNGISDEAILLSPAKRKKMRQQLFIPENEIIILYAGRLDEIKGVDVLIKAFGLIVNKYSNCHLYIVGDGEDMNNYIEKGRGFWRKITYTGKLKKEDLYKFYQVADIGVIPSLYESFGYVAIEMMMHNIPMVVSGTSGLNEIVTDGINGYKIPINETDETVKISAEDIKNSVLDVIKSIHVKNNALRNVFLEKYTIQKTMGKYIALIYESVWVESYVKSIKLMPMRDNWTTMDWKSIGSEKGL